MRDLYTLDPSFLPHHALWAPFKLLERHPSRVFASPETNLGCISCLPSIAHSLISASRRRLSGASLWPIDPWFRPMNNVFDSRLACLLMGLPSCVVRLPFDCENRSWYDVDPFSLFDNWDGAMPISYPSRLGVADCWKKPV
jgi:hypothetical protein